MVVGLNVMASAATEGIKDKSSITSKRMRSYDVWKCEQWVKGMSILHA